MIDKDVIRKTIISFIKWLNRQYNKTLYRKYRKKKSLSPTTKNTIIKRVEKILKDIGKEPEQLTKKDIMRYEEKCLRKYEPNGNNNRFQALNYLLRFLDHDEWCVKLLPVQRKRYETLTESERKKLLRISNQLKPLDRAIISLLLEGVCRPVDIQNITIKNIRFEECKILLEQSKTGEHIINRGDIDVIFMTPMIKDALKMYLKIRETIVPKKEEYREYLFLHEWNKYYGTPIGYEKIRNTVKNAVALAHINTGKKITPYTLKRTEITREFDRGVNPEITRIRARHSNSETTNRYNHKQENEITTYLFSEQYNDDVTVLPIEHQMKILAQKVIREELSMEDFDKLRSILEKRKPTPEKNSHIGYA